MRTKQLLRRLDAHMARGNELFDRNQTLLDENREAFRDLRSFLRELTLRHERGFEALLKQSADQAAKHTAAWENARDEIVGELRDTRREIVSELRAQRQALFRILDRLPNGGRGGTAGA